MKWIMYSHLSAAVLEPLKKEQLGQWKFFCAVTKLQFKLKLWAVELLTQSPGLKMTSSYIKVFMTPDLTPEVKNLWYEGEDKLWTAALSLYEECSYLLQKDRVVYPPFFSFITNISNSTWLPHRGFYKTFPNLYSYSIHAEHEPLFWNLM